MTIIIFRLTSIILAMSVLISACTTSTYIFKGQPKQMPNGTIEFEEPQVEKKLNWLGYIGIAIGTGAGGYVGYHSNMSISDKVEPTTNAIYGGLAGTVVTTGLILLLSGKQPALGPTTTASWLHHIDNNLRLVSNRFDDSNRVQAIVAIRTDGDTAFHIKTMEDAQAFDRLFRDSPYRPKAVQEAAMNVEWPKLPELLVLFPEEAMTIKRAIARRSPSISECMEITSGYPEVQEEAMARAESLFDSLSLGREFDMVKTYPMLSNHAEVHMATIAKDELDYKIYLSLFKNGKYHDEILKKYLRILEGEINGINNISQLGEMVKSIPELELAAEKRASDLAIANELYEPYLAVFPNGLSSKRIQSLLADQSKSIQQQVDKDLPVFRIVVSDFRQHVSRLATGIRSDAGDATRLISSNEDLYYRLQKAEPYMSPSQKSIYKTYMDGWEQTASWLQRISP